MVSASVFSFFRGVFFVYYVLIISTVLLGRLAEPVKNLFLILQLNDMNVNIWNLKITRKT